jgi:hypothetical protein
MAAAATARSAPARRAAAAPARRPAPVRRPAPARRRPPAPRKPPKRAPRGHLIPLAAVRTAATVRHLPDSGLMVRMTRGRVWIGVLGVLLVGIVALNVVTLSFAASTGKIEENIQALEGENSLLRARDAQRSGISRVRHEAAALGLTMPAADQVQRVEAGPRDAAVAARRLAAGG